MPRPEKRTSQLLGLRGGIQSFQPRTDQEGGGAEKKKEKIGVRLSALSHHGRETQEKNGGCFHPSGRKVFIASKPPCEKKLQPGGKSPRVGKFNKKT